MNSTLHQQRVHLPSLREQGKQFWSSEEDEKLARLRAEGLKWDEIAHQLPGRTVRAICARHYKLLARERPPQRRYYYSPDEDARILQLRKEGITYEQMVSHFKGHSKGALVARYHRIQHQPTHSLNGPASHATLPQSPD